MQMPLRSFPVPSGESVDLLLVSADAQQTQRFAELLRGAAWLATFETESTLAGALDRLERRTPSVILLDPALPDGAGPATARRLHEKAPAVPIIVLAEAEDDPATLATIRAGADDYLTREEATERVLRRAVRSALARVHDRQRFEQHLQHAARMEALGQLAGGVVHDLNNLLQIVVANLYLLEPMIQHDPDALQRLQGARRTVARNAELVKRLLSFSRHEEAESKIIDPNELIAGLRELLTRTLGRNVRFQTALEPAVGPIQVDPSQLESALVNLTINSRDAMPRGGSVTVTTRNETLDEICASAIEAAPGEYVAIAVTDDGGGIPPEVLSRVFDPFFTTKEPGKGSGLGLSMVRAFIRQARGAVTLESQIGRGTTVTLFLRRAGSERVSRLDETVQVAPLRLHHVRVIVADPEPEVREAVRATLESLGFVALDAGGMDELARLVEAHADTGVLLVDDALEETSGEQIRQLGVPVVWMSAGGAGTPASAEDRHVLRKPIARGALANAIQVVLKAPEG